APGEAIELKGGTLEVDRFDIDQADWKQGQFKYEDEPFENDFKELERQYGVTVVCEAKDPGTCFGGFNSHESILEALASLLEPSKLRLSYEVVGNQVIIREV